MKITEYIKDHILYLDGGMGTLLQAQGLAPGELPERWNVTAPDIIIKIHRDYLDAGSHVICTNTFGANSLKFSSGELEEIVKAAVANAKAAKAQSSGRQDKWIALDIGPTGRMLAPYGDLDFEEAVSVFAETVKLGVKYGVDLILIETMNDSYETKAALLAAKENSELPVFVANAYGEDGKLMTGASPAAMVAMLEGLGADAVGVNCSLGPKALAGVVEEYLTYASVPVILKPNAGLPKAVGTKTVYDVEPAEFAEDVAVLIRKGVRAAGGCCGTTPAYISAMINASADVNPAPVEKKEITCVSSYTHAVVFGEKPVLIGERINPTGKKRFKEALKANDVGYILKEGIEQGEKGVHILDVNVGLPEIDERRLLKSVVCELQAVVDLPLQIDTSDPVAMETALRRYNGKAMVNSVNGKKESMEAVFPLVKKYGGLVVALTLDENGIPKKAEERLQIAKTIVAEAKKYGINKKDLIFDPLAMAVSADQTSAAETLRAVAMIRKELGCHTSLGVSNVSFGLPGREMINSTYFALALGRGLSAAIMNPYSAEMMKSYYAYCALAGIDGNCMEYITFAQTKAQAEAAARATAAGTLTAKASAPARESAAGTQTPTTCVEVQAAAPNQDEYGSALKKAVAKGLKEQAALLTTELLETVAPMQVIQEEIIPALDAVGAGFEEKKVYLPQLLMSAEAAKSAFEVIRKRMSGGGSISKCSFVIATVKGDIHDIGKNIVRLLLENYGFAVTDLGRDVAPELVVSEAVRLHAPLVGLSALMTTTVPAMEETIRMLRREAPWCKIVVGGAVLNQEYADAIGADKYARDAMETVRYAEAVYRSLNEGASV